MVHDLFTPSQERLIQSRTESGRTQILGKETLNKTNTEGRQDCFPNTEQSLRNQVENYTYIKERCWHKLARDTLIPEIRFLSEK